MSTEFKLSYTASEINEKLGKVAQPDWNVNDESDPSYVKGRTHYEIPPEFDIQWDGVIGDRFALDMSSLGYTNTYMVKVSDKVFSADELIGATYINSSGGEYVITSSKIDTTAFPGALNINGGVATIVYSSDDLNAALGLPAGYVTNGTYFVYIVDSRYTNRLVAPIEIKKIDDKYLPNFAGRSVEGQTFEVNGESFVAAEGAEIFNDYEYNVAIGNYSHAEGHVSCAEGAYSHAEGWRSHAEGEASHAEGYSSHAEGHYSHAEGYCSHAEGDRSHAEGNYSHAEGHYSHAEGDRSHAEGAYSHAEGWCSHAEGEASHAEGNYSHAEGNYSHAEGSSSHAEGAYSHAEGQISCAEGDNSHAEGSYTHAEGSNSHAEGMGTSLQRTITGEANATTYTVDSVDYLIAGASIRHTVAVNYIPTCRTAKIISIDESNFTITLDRTLSDLALNNQHVNVCISGMALGDNSHSEGKGTVAAGRSQHTHGEYNIIDPEYDVNNNARRSKYAHIVGNGIAYNARSNAYTLDWNGNAWYRGAVTSSGADYAEFFEWEDGNPNDEDRAGHVVTLRGDKIAFANSEDNILGIISGTVAILGDNAECAWKKKYVTDKFGRIVYDMVEEFHTEIDHETGEETKTSIGFYSHPRLNPDFNPNEKYISREDRPEWDKVGMFGKIYTLDDGTCVSGGYGKVGANGVLTNSDSPTNIYIMKRTSDDVVLVLLR